MGKIFFTSDFYLDNLNIIKRYNRPFKDVKIMNKTIINNFLSKVDRFNDTLYYLGNLTTNKLLIEHICFNIFPVKTIFIRGNYDHLTNEIKKNIPNYDIKVIKINTKIITLCHYCMHTWYNSQYNTWHLHGHNHSILETTGKSYDVSVDNNNFMPISLDEIEKIINNRPNNVDYIKKEKK